MLNRTTAPEFKKTTHFELIEPEVVRLLNGAPVYFLKGGQQEVIKIELIFKAGKWYEQYSGAAHFASNLLSKGTKQKNSFEIASIFDLYGAHVEVTPGLDLVSVSLYSLTKNLPSVLGLLFELLTESVFPDRELQQSKDIYIQNLKVNREKTSFQASLSFRKKLFGENHPYGKELEEDDVNSLSRLNVVSHFSRCYHDFFVIVSGKISEQNQTLISEGFAKLSFAGLSETVIPVPQSKPERIVTEKENSVQASVRIGKRFIGRSNPLYFDALLINHILGGYFGSRLMKNIREEKGLTYGVYSSIHTLIHDNYIAIGADVNKENLEITFDEIRKELKRLRQEPVPIDELQTARNHFIGSLQAEITTPFSHADKRKNIIIYSLPETYYTELIKRIDTLSQEDIMKAAELLFHEESFYEIAVG